MKACQDKGGRMVDVMRFLLTYGLDLITGMVDNKPCLSKLVKASVRRLLKEMVEYSTKELDSNLPKVISQRPHRYKGLHQHKAAPVCQKKAT